MSSTWTSSDPLWKSLNDHQKVAAMAMMEAGQRNVNDAVNAASAMVNRAHRNAQPLGEHVSGRIYQPTFEPAQHSRLPGIVSSSQFGALTDWVAARDAGQVPDTVGGATHFLAKPEVMLGLERQNPGKYRDWGPRGSNWTGYDPATGRYANQTVEDSSHAFLAPEGRYIDGETQANSGDLAARLRAKLAQTAAAKDSSGKPVAVGTGQPLTLTQTAALGAAGGGQNTATPGASVAPLPMPPDDMRAALSKALMEEAAQNKPKTGMELLGSLAQYTSGYYGLNSAASEKRDWNKRWREAQNEALNSGDRRKLLSVMAQNPETAPAAMTAMLQETGTKAQDWQALPAQTDSYGRPLPARVMNKHTGEVKNIDGTAAASSGAAAPPVMARPATATVPSPFAQTAPQQSLPDRPTVVRSERYTPDGTLVSAPQTAAPAPVQTQTGIPAPAVQTQPAQAPVPAQSGYEHGQAVPKPPEGYVQRQDEQGFLYKNDVPQFESKADMEARLRLMEKKKDAEATTARGAEDMLKTLQSARSLPDAPGFTNALKYNSLPNGPNIHGMGINADLGLGGLLRSGMAKAATPSWLGGDNIPGREDPMWGTIDRLSQTGAALKLAAMGKLKGFGQIRNPELQMIDELVANVQKSQGPADYQFRINALEKYVQDQGHGETRPNVPVSPTIQEMSSAIHAPNDEASNAVIGSLAAKYNTKPQDMLDYIASAKSANPYQFQAPAAPVPQPDIQPQAAPQPQPDIQPQAAPQPQDSTFNKGQTITDQQLNEAVQTLRASGLDDNAIRQYLVNSGGAF
jgi:hypothetical protein